LDTQDTSHIVVPPFPHPHSWRNQGGRSVLRRRRSTIPPTSSSCNRTTQTWLLPLARLRGFRRNPALWRNPIVSIPPPPLHNVGVVGVVFGHFHYYWIAPKTGDECFAMRGKGVATARCGGGKLAVNDENKLVSAHGFYPFVVVAILHHQINSGEPTVNEKLAISIRIKSEVGNPVRSSRSIRSHQRGRCIDQVFPAPRRKPCRLNHWGKGNRCTLCRNPMARSLPCADDCTSCSCKEGCKWMGWGKWLSLLPRTPSVVLPDRYLHRGAE